MNRFVQLVLPAMALSTAGCDHPDKAGHPAVDPRAIQAELRSIEAQWNRDYAAHDGAAIAGHYAKDAALANPGAPLVAGEEGIRAATKEFAADPNLQVQFASDRIQVGRAGELAYTRGHFTMRSTDPATHKPRTDSGNYLTVWQKQADGSWKAVEDFVTPGPAQP